MLERALDAAYYEHNLMAVAQVSSRESQSLLDVFLHDVLDITIVRFTLVFRIRIIFSFFPSSSSLLLLLLFTFVNIVVAAT